MFQFDGQWKQTPIYAIYTHWWIKRLFGVEDDKLRYYSNLIEQLIQSNGWIYNPDVSETQVRTRMKSELLMSLAMGIEILSYSKKLENYSDLFLATISSYPFTGYVSAEYFRMSALEKLGKTVAISKEIEYLLQYCQAGEGFCDFSVTSKVDDYMGTLKRVNRDKAIHSPLISMYANYISNINDKTKEMVNSKLINFGQYLIEKPMDIPAFRMRDIEVPFGSDITPLEIVSANYIIDHYN